jgi:hypothetical protein
MGISERINYQLLVDGASIGFSNPWLIVSMDWKLLINGNGHNLIRRIHGLL